MTYIPTVILVLVSGYIFLLISNFTKFDIYKNPGHPLFFKSALIGYILWGLGDTSISGLEILGIIDDVDDSKLIIPSLGVIYGIVFSIILNVFYRESKAEQKAAKRRGDSLYLAVHGAIDRSQSVDKIQLVEFTMKSGKTCIGYPGPLKLKSEYVDLIPYDANGVKHSNSKVSLKVEEIETVKLYVPISE